MGTSSLKETDGGVAKGWRSPRIPAWDLGRWSPIPSASVASL